MTDHYCDNCGAELSPMKHAYIEFAKRQKRTLKSRLGAMPFEEAFDRKRWDRELGKAFADVGVSGAEAYAAAIGGCLEVYLKDGDDIDEAQRLAGPV
ncbi:MAG: hypothetical protein H0V26_00480 [Solirubrobacterales bacterium]|nr:hypothetical protein [Solirubrobacterales bacterium]